MTEKLVTVTVKAEGWLNYTGSLAGHAFVDGRSVNAIPLRAALKIGAIVEVYDEQDVRLHPSTYPREPGVSDRPAIGQVTYPTADAESTPAPYVPETPAPEQDEAIDLEPARTIDALTGQVKVTYTRAQLEAIADKRGINGLREIGEPLEVKGRSIPELITKILEAQA